MDIHHSRLYKGFEKEKEARVIRTMNKVVVWIGVVLFVGIVVYSLR